MSYQGYGLFRGINEGYQSYLQRDAQIKAEELAEQERAYQNELRKREREEYEYGLSRRPIQEEKTALELKGLRRNERIAGMDEEDLYSDEAREGRIQAVKDQNTAIRQQNQIRSQELVKNGLQISNAVTEANIKKLQTQYNDWAKKVNSGEWGLQELKEAYNNDDIEGNNVESIERTDKGVVVRYTNGQVETYKGGERQIVQMLQENANPAFLENILLNEQNHRFALAEAYADAQQVDVTELSEMAEKWGKRGEAYVKAVYGRMFPTGIDFGTDGNDKMAGAVMGMINRIGKLYKFDQSKISPAEVATMLGDLAEKTMETNPDVRNKRAAEVYDNMGLEDLVATAGKIGITDLTEKPDADSVEGQAILKQLVYEQAMADLQAFEGQALEMFLGVNPETGEIETKPAPDDAKQEEPSIVGLEDIVSENASNDMVDDPEAVKRPKKGFAAAAGQSTPPRDMQPFLAEVRKQIGTTGILRGKALKDHKAKVKKHYVENFDNYDREEKIAFLEAYGPMMPKSLLAEAKQKVPKAVASKKPKSKFKTRRDS